MICQSILDYVSVDLHRDTDRYKTAAILGILTVEILKVFDEVLRAKSGSSDDGVLVKFGGRIVVVIVIG